MRHQRACRKQAEPDARCNCEPGYRAWVYDATGKTKIRRTFPNLNEAKRWRAITSITGRPAPPPQMPTFEEEARSFIEGIRSGAILNRSGAPYKPSVVRAYERDLERYIYPAIGEDQLDRITRADLRGVTGELRARESSRSKKPLKPATVRNALLPVRAVYRNAILDQRIEDNPTTGLVLEQVHSRRERVASREEIPRLLAPLRPEDRAIFATALYAGLRLGELRALRWQDVDFASNELRVEGLSMTV